MDLASVPRDLFCPRPSAGEAAVNQVGTAPSRGELETGTHTVHGAATAETSQHVGVPSPRRLALLLEVGGCVAIIR